MIPHTATEKLVSFMHIRLKQTVQHMLKSSPHNAFVDPVNFLESIKYTGEDRTENTVTGWDFGEQISRLNLEQEQAYAEAWARVDVHTKSTQAKTRSAREHF
jgi:hypothetical protein